MAPERQYLGDSCLATAPLISAIYRPDPHAPKQSSVNESVYRPLNDRAWWAQTMLSRCDKLLL